MLLVTSPTPGSAQRVPAPAALVIRTDAGMRHSHPTASVGIPVVLNAEWKHYRGGPVSGAAAVPSLVDRDGFFFAPAAHVGLDDAELGALLDMNTDHPLPDMSKHRQAELDALTSPRVLGALRGANLQLLTYRTLIAKRPAGRT